MVIETCSVYVRVAAQVDTEVYAVIKTSSPIANPVWGNRRRLISDAIANLRGGAVMIEGRSDMRSAPWQHVLPAASQQKTLYKRPQELTRNYPSHRILRRNIYITKVRCSRQLEVPTDNLALCVGMLLGVLQEARPTVRRSAQITQPRPAPTRMMQSHNDSLLAVAFFKDGRRVVTASHDKTLRISDMQKGSLVGGPFEGHKDYVRSVTVSPDDRRIASGGDDKAIIIWDVETKQMVFDPLEKHTGWVLSVCFSPDGKRLASGSHDKTVVVWDAETGGVLATLDSHNNSVWSVAFSPDGLKLASGSADHSIRIWRSDSAELLLEINAHQHWVRSVVWSPDSKQLVSASFDKTVRFWSSDNGDQIGQSCTGHTYHSLAISSDGSFIATASDDKTLRLWSTKTHKLIGQVLEHAALVRCSIALSPNGELLVSGDGEGKVLLCSLKNILEQHNAEEEISEDEESQQDRLSFSESQLRGHEESICNHGSPSNHPSEIDEDSDIDDEHSLFHVSCLPSMCSLMTECELALCRSLLYTRRFAIHPLLASLTPLKSC
ncbi:WD40 repeat-like protein [Suillus brevipes Sb2]|nr:WD40 repeat-like protein [Suillus brevipes Sb2]